MSSAVYPGPLALPGVTYSVKRRPTFQNRIQVAISGKETRIADWSFPRYSYELNYEFLRTDAVFLELQRLAGFYLAHQGSFDSWLFDDVDDDAVTAQFIAVGDGTTTAFQLQRSYGVAPGALSTGPVFAPNIVSAVYLNGNVQSAGSYSVAAWGSTAPPPGTLTFTSPPASGAVITADFTFYWPCRFTEDTLELTKFMKNLWLAQSVKFTTIK